MAKIVLSEREIALYAITSLIDRKQLQGWEELGKKGQRYNYKFNLLENKELELVVTVVDKDPTTEQPHYRGAGSWRDPDIK